MSARRSELPVKQTECHPVRHNRWLFIHNGCIADLAAAKRDLVLAVGESLFAEIAGQVDTGSCSTSH